MEEFVLAVCIGRRDLQSQLVNNQFNMLSLLITIYEQSDLTWKVTTCHLEHSDHQISRQAYFSNTHTFFTELSKAFLFLIK